MFCFHEAKNGSELFGNLYMYLTGLNDSCPIVANYILEKWWNIFSQVIA